MSAVLELRGVRAGYGESADILHEIDFAVERGESAVILGGNGSGKSTLLRVGAGLLTPRAGNVFHAPGARLGFVLQNPRTQLIAESVQGELSYTLELLGRSREQAALESAEFLREFDLERLARRAPQELSGGEQQRVALACVLIRRPTLLLLDEPDAFLDARSRLEFHDFLERRSDQVTKIFTSSRPANVRPGARVLRLQNGRLVS